MLKKICGPLLLAACIFSCGEEKYGVTIDNPTKEKLTVDIDGEIIVLDTMQLKAISLGPGKHTMKLRDSAIDFSIPKYVYHSDNVLLINPTRSAYILEQVDYMKYGNLLLASEAAEVMKRKMDTLANRIRFDTIRVMNVMSITGNYKRTDAMFMEDNWDYHINQPVPEKVQGSVMSKERQLVKIYRERDFLFHLMKQ
jgi:hypothetical protein